MVADFVSTRLQAVSVQTTERSETWSGNEVKARLLAYDDLDYYMIRQVTCLQQVGVRAWPPPKKTGKSLSL